MNKFGIVFGAAAVVVIAGCKDPDYKYANSTSSQNEAKTVGTTEATQPAATQFTDIPAAKRCTCAPGTKHDKPCACGAPDCMCVVEAAPVIVADLSRPAPAGKDAAAEATTTYIVQNGDYLAKISKKFNVTISSIKKLNPSIGAKNIVRVGQKLKLPGKIDVGVQAEPAKPALRAGAKKAYAPYAGATKEYVVKSGDTLGAIAYSNGINIRQLKELNGLKKDMVRVGQKLNIPAEKVVAAKPAAAKKAAAAPKAAAQPAVQAAEAKKEAPAENADAAAPAANAADAAAAEPTAAQQPAGAAAPAASDAASATTSYIVQEGDDITGVSIRFGVSAAVIRELNNLGEKDQLVPGQIIKLPADVQE